MSFSKGSLAIALAAVLFVGILLGTGLNRPALAQPGGGNGMPRYTVVETEGVHLIVTDNVKQTLYFYAIAKDAKPGADLHLRGTVDLRQVGKEIIRPTLLVKGDDKK